jgi:hypothetical protein
VPKVRLRALERYFSHEWSAREKERTEGMTGIEPA